MKTTISIPYTRSLLRLHSIGLATLAFLIHPLASQAASPDGKTWTAQDSGVSASIRSISGNSLDALFFSAGHIIKQYNPTTGTWSEMTSWTTYSSTIPGYDKNSGATLISSINGQIAATRFDGTESVAFFDGTVWSHSPTTNLTARTESIFTTGVTAGGITLTGRSNGRIYRFEGNEFKSSTLPTGAEGFQSFHATDNKIWASDFTGNVFSSTDGGATWTSTPTKPSVNNLRAIFALDDSKIIAVEGTGDVRITQNGGSSWSYHNLPDASYITGVYAESLSSIWVIGHGGYAMYYNGVTWTSFADQLPGLSGLTGGASNLWAIHGVDGELFIAGGLGRLYTTAIPIPEHGTTAALFGAGSLAAVLLRRKGRHAPPRSAS